MEVTLLLTSLGACAPAVERHRRGAVSVGYLRSVSAEDLAWMLGRICSGSGYGDGDGDGDGYGYGYGYGDLLNDIESITLNDGTVVTDLLAHARKILEAA
jgi:hypothetical protein